MANLVNKVANLLGVAREEDKDKVSDSAPNNENEQVQAIENLSAQVEQTNLDVTRKSANCALEEVMIPDLFLSTHQQMGRATLSSQVTACKPA